MKPPGLIFYQRARPVAASRAATGAASRAAGAGDDERPRTPSLLLLLSFVLLYHVTLYVILYYTLLHYTILYHIILCYSTRCCSALLRSGLFAAEGQGAALLHGQRDALLNLFDYYY